MSVFPIDWEDKEDSPELLAFMQQYGAKKYLSAAEINIIRDALIELKSLIVNPVITKTLVTYTSSTIFTIPQNSQILSVVVGELRSLNEDKYTYNPLLDMNNFEIIDANFILDMDSGTKIEITTI